MNSEWHIVSHQSGYCDRPLAGLVFQRDDESLTVRRSSSGCSKQSDQRSVTKEAVTNVLKHFRAYLLVCSLVVVWHPFQGLARQNSDAAKDSVQHTAAERDGQHDFDFELGTWKIHLKRLVHPLTGSTTWVEFDGTSVTRKVWDGRAQLEEFETDSPAGGHIEGLTLRAHDRRIQGWTRRVLRRGTVWPQWQSHPGSIHLVEDQHEFASLRTVVLGGWWQNLGSKLDHGP